MPLVMMSLELIDVFQWAHGLLTDLGLPPLLVTLVSYAALGGMVFGFGFLFVLLGVAGSLVGALIGTRFTETEQFRRILASLQL